MITAVGRWEADAGEALVIEGGSAAWGRLHERFAHRFGRAVVRARVRRYLAGLLARAERKDGWPVADGRGHVPAVLALRAGEQPREPSGQSLSGLEPIPLGSMATRSDELSESELVWLREGLGEPGRLLR
jgi:hypothetical protein